MNKTVISSRHSRRQFIKYGSLAVGGAALTGPYLLRGQNLNSQLNIAQIGCSGKGGSDAQWCASTENLVALCDVNSDATDAINAALSQSRPAAKVYKDFRELFDKDKDFDAMDIAVPDHSHAIIAATAMKLGKHVYCQKPLTHDVYEARLLRDLARQYKVATQMGNQGSASDGLRRGVEIVQAGLIGPVHQAYVWTNRPIWPQGFDRPAGSDPVPSNLDWDLWLGTAPARPFKEFWPDAQAADMAQLLRYSQKLYQPFNWRGWIDFGTGALGDMACHTVNWPFRALKLGYPTEIEATSSGMKSEMYPVSSRIRFEFPARNGLPPVTLYWADGGNTPPAEVTEPITSVFGGISHSGCIMVGDKGMVFSPDDGDQELRVFVKLKDDKEIMAAPKSAAVNAIPETIPRNAFDNTAPPDLRHHQEWIAACKSGKHDTAYSNFEIAAYLTEIMLLGCVALRAGQKIEWDGPGMKATNDPGASRFIKREYRAGWKI
jgi:predicted dehydrogenase